MEKQTSFAQGEFAAKKKRTRRERFLAEMEKLVPWGRLIALIEPFYPKGKRGRPPIGLERMLRVYFLSQWYALADEALEDALYDSQALRNFARIDLGSDPVPDATTLLHFRHLLEDNKLTEALFAEIGGMLREKGISMREGTIVDATIISAPSSTKNQDKKRDQEMHQTKKGNQWYFGMKAHVGVDLDSGVVHTVEGTAASVSDVAQAHALLHGEEKEVLADAGYIGVEKRPEVAERHPGVRWSVARKRGQVKALPESQYKPLIVGIEKCKAQLRACVEHPFHIVKNLFGYRKVRYRGLAKNTAQLHTLFALANLLIAKRALLRQAHA
jgi:IS5 family transposase